MSSPSTSVTVKPAPKATSPAIKKADHWMPKLWDHFLRNLSAKSIFEADDNDKAVGYFRGKAKVTSHVTSDDPKKSGAFLAEERQDLVVCFGLTEQTAAMKFADFLDTLVHNTNKVVVINGKLLKKNVAWWTNEFTKAGLHFRPDLSVKCRSLVPKCYPELKGNLLVFVWPNRTI
jgi:hypothetical protein